MIRQSIVRSSRPLAHSVRTFASTARVMSNPKEGDTGAPRAHGQQDAFTKREQASEESYIREQEKAKLKSLQAKLQEQASAINELEKSINKMLNEDDKKK